MHKIYNYKHVHHITQHVILLKMYSFLPKEDCKKMYKKRCFKDLNQIFFLYPYKVNRTLKALYKTTKTSIYM